MMHLCLNDLIEFISIKLCANNSLGVVILRMHVRDRSFVILTIESFIDLI